MHSLGKCPNAFENLRSFTLNKRRVSNAYDANDGQIGRWSYPPEYSGVITEDEDGLYTVDCRDGPTMVTLGSHVCDRKSTGCSSRTQKRQEEVLKQQEEEESIRVARGKR